jgi:hypothetical protein
MVVMSPRYPGGTYYSNSRTISEDCAKGDYSSVNGIMPRQRTFADIGFPDYGTNTTRDNQGKTQK